jgi:NAD(P)H-hydrate epimerase
VLASRYQTELSGGTIVAAGTGNNGGDGWVLARALSAVGVPVWVATLPGQRSPLCAAAADRAEASGVRTLAADGPWPSAALVIDAILGTGASGAPRPAAQALLDRIHDLGVPVVALDGPTGLDLGTGVVHGQARADLSITFGGPRRGHLLARDEAGAIVVLDIGLPPPEPSWPRLVTDEWAAHHFPVFKATDHKGTRGRIVIVGGAPGMSGAVRMAARSAFAAGAGYVHVVAPAETIAELRGAEPDVLTMESGLGGSPGNEVLELVSRADALIIGPGLGRAEDRVPFVVALLDGARRVVADADALTIFQGRADALASALRDRAALLTPHPGEFRSLVPDLDAGREVDPWGAAQQAADRLGATVLLKGVPTIVATPGSVAWTIAAGNPGLGTGGSGDILSGICGVFLAQLGEPALAASLAAQALGRAGDLAARRLTAHSMRPMDVVQQLPDVWRDWETRRAVGWDLRPPVLAELAAPATV